MNSERLEKATVILAPLSGVRTVSEKAEDLGLQRLKSAPGDVRYLVQPNLPQPGHNVYVQNFATFMAANRLQEKVRFGHKWHPFQNDASIFSFARPKIGVVFQGRQTEEMTQFLDSTPHEVFKQGSKIVNIFADPSPDVLNSILGIPGASRRCDLRISGGTDIERYIPLMQMEKLISYAISSNYYPAYTNEDHYMQVYEAIDENTEQSNDVSQQAKKRTRTNEDTEKDKDATMTHSPAVAAAAAAAADSAEKKADATEGAAKSDVRYIRYYRAKPSEPGDFECDKTYQTQDDLVWIPFFDFLAKEDIDSIRDFLSNYCAKLLGKSIEEQLRTINNFMSAFTVVANTLYGQNLAHIVTCFKIGLKAQACALPVIQDRRYYGCLIRGTGYRLTLHGKSVEPVSGDNFGRLLGQYDCNRSILRNLEKEMGVQGLEDIDSMRRLDIYLRNLRVSKLQIKESGSLLRKLRFSTPFWKVRRDTIQAAFFALHEDKELDSACAMHWSAVGQDRGFRTLAVFGNRAPTLRIPGGTKTPLDGSSKVPPRFCFALKEVAAALLDWRSIEVQHYLLMPAASMSVKNRFVPMKDGAPLWEFLNEACGEKKEKKSKKTEEKDLDQEEEETATAFHGF